MQDFEILEYRPEFQESIVALHSEAFEFAPGESRDYLDWKYRRNPYIEEPLIVVARDRDGAIVGMRGFYGTCWEARGERIVLPCADDFAIADRERDKGLMTRIMRVALQSLVDRGYAAALNASGGKMTVLQSLAMGWKSLGAMEPVARFSRPERVRRFLDGALVNRRFVWRFARQNGGHRSGSFTHLDEQARRKAGSGGVVLETSPRSEAMAQLACRVHSDERIRHVRDEDFYCWRYRNPTRDYRFLLFERDGVLEGYLAIASCRRSRLPISVVDIEARTDDVAGVLLESALAWGRFPAVGTWFASYPPGVRRHLTRLGFVPTDIDQRARGLPCVLYKRLGDAEPLYRVMAGAEWDLRLIDSMHG